MPGSLLKFNLMGRAFGRLTVVGRSHRHSHWLCRCQCGVFKHVESRALRDGRTSSCGCLNIEKFIERNLKHGNARSTGHSLAYSSWKHMRSRCKTHPDYAGRGIRVCERWARSFSAFLEDMGPRPSRAHSIDRIDNSGHYEPGNCRWATQAIQTRNVRRNRIVSVNGAKMCRTDAALALGLDPARVEYRLRRGYGIWSFYA